MASSDNSVFYDYAVSTPGSPTRWAGDREVKVEGTIYQMKGKNQMKGKKLTLDRERNRYLLELTCPN